MARRTLYTPESLVKDSLASNAAAGDTELDLTDVSGFPSGGGYVLVRDADNGDELVEYTGVDTNNDKLTGVNRGQEGTSDVLHESGKTVFLADSARYLKDIQNNLNLINPSDATLQADTIQEDSSDAGVTVDGVLIKDGNVDGVDVSAHAGSTSNPHSVTASQVGAPSSVDGVANDGGDIDLLASGAITLSPDDNNDQITIGESHSSATNNPHSVTASQVGSPTSIDGVANAGGDVDLIGGTGITISPDDANNQVTFAADEANIDHDSLQNYVADEHLRWDNSISPNIHDDNIAQSSVTQHEGAIDHDALTNYVANEHQDHTAIAVDETPDADATRNLGSSSKAWANLYVGSVKGATVDGGSA